MRNEDNREDSSNIDKLLLLHPNNLVFISKSFRKDLPGIFIEVNNTVIKTLGYSSEELQSMTFFDLISQETIPLLEKRRKKLIEDSFVEYTITCITKDRKKISLHCKNYLLLSNTDIIELTIAKEEDAVRKKSEEKQVIEVEKEPEINLDIFEKNGLAALLLDDNLNIIQANAIFLEMTMVSRSDSISLNLFDFVKKDYLRKEFSKSIINEQDESLFPLSINGVLMDANNDHKSIKMNVGRYQQGYYVISFIDQTKQELLQNALSTSEKKYRELVQNAHDMIFLYPISEDGKRGSFIEVNRKAYERLGYSREELLEKKLPDIVRRGKYKEHLEEEILEKTKKELQKTGTAVRDGILVSKNGEEIPTEFRASMFTIENEEVILVIARDISERQKAEQALKESEEKYSTVVESSNDGILISQNSKIVFANNKIAEMLGYTSEDVIGLAPKDLVGKKYQDIVSEYYQRRLNGDPTVPSRYEVTLVTSDGIEIPFENNVSVIEYMGKPATLNIARDISERKKAEQALRESEEKYSTVVES
ncbi:MAG: PAS domain S-box protein, partial [Candidatus Heimdallarchaeaceae archaeon]